MHVIHVGSPNDCGAQWTFDGNVDTPTFSPSVNIRCEWSKLEDEAGLKDEACHYFLKAGQLQFLPDSTHELAGQTVPLPDLPDGVLPCPA